jgi:hypothetical protein
MCGAQTANACCMKHLRGIMCVSACAGNHLAGQNAFGIEAELAVGGWHCSTEVQCTGVRRSTIVNSESSQQPMKRSMNNEMHKQHARRQAHMVVKHNLTSPMKQAQVRNCRGLFRCSWIVVVWFRCSERLLTGLVVHSTVQIASRLPHPAASKASCCLLSGTYTMQSLGRVLLCQLRNHARQSSPAVSAAGVAAAAALSSNTTAGPLLSSIRLFSSEGSQRLYVGNLSFDATQEDVQAAFERFGTVRVSVGERQV